jgi:hypothetical protein
VGGRGGKRLEYETCLKVEGKNYGGNPDDTLAVSPCLLSCDRIHSSIQRMESAPVSLETRHICARTSSKIAPSSHGRVYRDVGMKLRLGKLLWMVRDDVERGLNVLGRVQPRLVRPTILESGRPCEERSKDASLRDQAVDAPPSLPPSYDSALHLHDLDPQLAREVTS